MKTTLYLLFVFIFFLPVPAYAYLDPGSGNALVYVMMSFFGAFVFSLKSLFYSIIGRKNNDDKSGGCNYNQIVIFSEGKQYWSTFKVTVESLIERKIYFSYYTMNVNDPCLAIDSPYINNRYIGNGSMAYMKIGSLKADVLLSTTPNIGTDGFPILRSTGVKELVHVFHSYDGIGAYHIGSLDKFDTVLTVGDFEEKVIRDLEAARNLPNKKIVPVGLPYIDELWKNKKESKSFGSNNITVLVAPSWSTKGCLTEYGAGFIKDLAMAGFNVIIRPHPQSLLVEQDLLRRVESALSGYGNVVWDTDVDGTKSMASADVMISDASRVRVDFMLVYNKPVITLEVPTESMQQFESKYMEEIWIEEQIAKYGRKLNHESVVNIVDVVREVTNDDMSVSLCNFRDKHVFNWGHSGEIVADYLIETSKQYQEEISNAAL